VAKYPFDANASGAVRSNRRAAAGSTSADKACVGCQLLGHDSHKAVKLAKLPITEGDAVKGGDTLAVIHS
jgi:hypothetical protein